jgi:beta-mannosidase
MPAQVPGNVRADLSRAIKIPDPHLDPQASTWVDRHPWLYETQFTLDRSANERLHLVLEGVDYVSWVYLNGHRLSPKAGHEGMFSQQIYETTDCASQDNTLAILIQGSDYLVDGSRRSRWERFLDRIEPGPGHERTERYQTVKCQMSYGWDFAPPVRTMGVWDDVYLVRSQDITIHDLWLKPVFEAEPALAVAVTVGAPPDGLAREMERGRLRMVLSGHNFACDPQIHDFDVEWPGSQARGAQTFSWTLPVEDPRLWWPWDHDPCGTGAASLYDLTVQAYLADGTLSDEVTETVGLRRIGLEPNPHAPSDSLPWVMHINGEPAYVRGANWVPADILPGQVDANDYRALLELARDANMNALRVWGGGLREKRAFYDLCDEMGLLVWQEFPVACAFLTRYPRSAAYLDLAEREGRAIVRALRNHPSVVFWCGGNEFRPERHRDLVTRLDVAVKEEDGTRPFSPASPHRGDVHNWDVWHGEASVTEYTSEGYARRCQFASEYGLQAPPGVDALRAFLPAGELWPPGPAWEAHNAQLQALLRYARPFLNHGGATVTELEDVDLEAFVQAAQHAQAIGLQIAIEHLRRKKYACSGSLVWQLNEPWPAISWSLIDYLWHPKPAYQAVRRAYNPLLVSLEYPIRRYAKGDVLAGTVWVINDRKLDHPGCCVQLELWDEQGELHESWLHTMAVRADSVRAVGQIEWILPQDGDWTAIARLYQGDKVLTENRYDLSFYDTYRVSIFRRINRWLARLALGA